MTEGDPHPGPREHSDLLRRDHIGGHGHHQQRQALRGIAQTRKIVGPHRADMARIMRTLSRQRDMRTLQMQAQDARNPCRDGALDGIDGGPGDAGCVR